jgi:hypothetical protein
VVPLDTAAAELTRCAHEKKAETNDRRMMTMTDEQSTVIPVKPSFYYDSEGAYRAVAAPCAMEFTADGSGKLRGNYSPPPPSHMHIFGPVVAFFWMLAKSMKKVPFEIDLQNAKKVVRDDKRKEVGVLALIDDQMSWVCVKCPDQYEALTQRLSAVPEIRLVPGKMGKTGQTIILVMLCIFILMLLIMVVQSFTF